MSTNYSRRSRFVSVSEENAEFGWGGKSPPTPLLKAACPHTDQPVRENCLKYTDILREA